MKLGPIDVSLRRKAAVPTLSPVNDRGGWWPIIRESFPGAWQENIEVRAGDALAYFAVYACTSLIAGDVGKVSLNLVELDKDGIWHPTESPTYSPLLRKPNHFQNRIKFREQWIVSKLTNGNTYVLKERDANKVVRALYILDPTRVRPLVAPSGDVYYQLYADNLAGISGLPPEGLVVPASEIIHDIQCALFHPLAGVSPIFACGVAAMQGLAIQGASNKFFAAGSKPGGILTAPGPIPQDTADRLKEYWDSNFSGNNVGKIAVLGDGLKYEAMSVTAHDAQLIEQLKFSAETVCSCYHVLPYMIGIGSPPPYANVEPLLMAYYAQALQTQFNSIELALEEGIGIGLGVPVGPERKTYGLEFDIDDLVWMDTATRVKAAKDSQGVLSTNESRRKFLGYGPTPGGDAVLSQQQNYSLEALAERDKDEPFKKELPPAPPQNALPPAPEPVPDDETKGLGLDWAKVLDLATKAVEAEVTT